MTTSRVIIQYYYIPSRFYPVDVIPAAIFHAVSRSYFSLYSIFIIIRSIMRLPRVSFPRKLAIRRVRADKEGWGEGEKEREREKRREKDSRERLYSRGQNNAILAM